MMPKNNCYDLIVIGSGPAGQKGAIAAAKAGKRVAIIEKRLASVGGVSLHHGTIPSKTIREAIMHLTGFKQKQVFELDHAAKRKIQMSELKKKLLQVVANELRTIRDQLGRNGVEVIEGLASFNDAKSINVQRENDSIQLDANHFLIATGSSPVRPQNVPFDGRTVFDSNEILNLESIPQSMIVIGGGVVGIEYAMMFAILGVKVTVVDKQCSLLRFCDREIVDCLIYSARSIGVSFRLGESVEQISRQSTNYVTVELESQKRLCAETVLFSGGRESNVRKLCLENAGVATGDRGKITCDDHFQTSVENIYAVGDVIGYPALASTSMDQGRRAVQAMFDQKATEQGLLPYGLYTVPEISMVGMTEDELTEKRIPYEIGMANFNEICRGQISGSTLGFLKILFHVRTKRILGVHCIGESATELIHIGQAVMHFCGTIDYFADNVFNYPTMAESYRVAALDGLNKFNTGALSIPVAEQLAGFAPYVGAIL